MTVIQFTVDGTPAPQGSKVRNRYGGMREDNPNTAPWRAAIAWKAREAMNGRPSLSGPVLVEISLTFARPQSHYRTGKHAGQLKPTAPLWCASKPDADKCARAILDALKGICIQDDARVANLGVSKLYGTPGATILIRPLDPKEAA